MTYTKQVMACHAESPSAFAYLKMRSIRGVETTHNQHEVDRLLGIALLGHQLGHCVLSLLQDATPNPQQCQKLNAWT